MVRATTSFLLIETLHIIRNFTNWFEFIEHRFLTQTVPLSLLEKEGSMIKTFVKVCFTHYSPSSYFFGFLPFHLRDEISEALQDNCYQLTRFFSENLLYFRSPSLFVRVYIVPIPFYDEGILEVSKVFWHIWCRSFLGFFFGCPFFGFI